MQDSGLVRRIDELGRIVIPKEIRRTLRIRSGDAIEINKEGENLVLKKHSPFKDFGRLVESVADILSATLEKECVITDSDRIIHSSKKQGIEKGVLLTAFCNQLMNERKTCLYKSIEEKIPNLYIAEHVNEIKERLFVPIVKDGDCYGLMVISSLNKPLCQEDYSHIDLTLKILLGNL